MKTDLLEKGAVLQRDKETYAIAPHLTAGIVSADELRKIADVADKYNVSAIKVTGAQRIALVGIKEENIDDAWEDLGMSPGAAIGLCVRSIKVCPGTTFCKRGLQDSVAVGSKLDNLGMLVDFKLVKGRLRELLETLDHRMLNELPAFENINPTAENIAQYVYNEMKKAEFFNDNAKLKYIQVWESPKSSVIYTED